MPHLIFEHSSALDAHLPALMSSAADAAASTGIVRAEDLKLRALPYTQYQLAVPGQQFVHLSVRLLEGRSGPQKRQLAETLRAVLVEHLPEVYSLSVEIIDMHAESYKKRLL